MSRSGHRRQRLLERIAAGEADVDSFARLLDVSASTIRRDLAAMSEEGGVARTYGDAVLVPAQREQAFSARERVNRGAKEAIATAAAALISDGDSVLLDSSKLGRATQPFWAPLPPRWTLITDGAATDEQVEPFARLPGVRVIRA